MSAKRGWGPLAAAPSRGLSVSPARGGAQEGEPDQGGAREQRPGQEPEPGQTPAPPSPSPSPSPSNGQQDPADQQEPQEGPLNPPPLRSQSAEPEISGEVDVKLASPRSAEQKRALSAAAALLLTHVDAARKAVGREDRRAALTHLDRALKQSRVLSQSAPRHALTTTLRLGDIRRPGGDQIRGTLVPIYDELRLVSALGPVEAAKRQSIRVAQPGTAVTDVDLQRTRVLLSTEATQAHLGAARAALAGKDEPRWEDADAALSAVQSGVIFEFVESAQPLVKASQNLALARARLSARGAHGDSDLADAQAALTEAADALDDFARAATGDTAREAGKMVTSLRALADDLEEIQGQDRPRRRPQSEIAKIDRFWNRVSDWRASAP